jgi:hypothetical protein
MKKLILLLVTMVLLFGAATAVYYANSDNSGNPANMPAPTPQPLGLQVSTPQDNFTYGTYEGPLNSTAEEPTHSTTYSLELPLNITANSYATKITYSLDATDNVTLTSNVTLSLAYGVHNMIVYAFDGQDKVCEARNVTFTVGYGYISPIAISWGQLQQTVNYFESRGLTVQIIDTSKWQNIIYLLYGGSVDLTSKEALADFAVKHGISTIYEIKSPGVVTFEARYGGSCALLATVYTYAVTVR